MPVPYIIVKIIYYYYFRPVSIVRVHKRFIYLSLFLIDDLKKKKKC